MAKFFVTRGGPSPDETVEADHCRITEVGALVFYVTEPLNPEPGQRTYDRMVKAFAPEYWAEVERLGHPPHYTQDQCEHFWVSAKGGPDGNEYLGYEHCGKCGVKKPGNVDAQA